METFLRVDGSTSRYWYTGCRRLIRPVVPSPLRRTHRYGIHTTVCRNVPLNPWRAYWGQLLLLTFERRPERTWKRILFLLRKGKESDDPTILFNGICPSEYLLSLNKGLPRSSILQGLVPWSSKSKTTLGQEISTFEQTQKCTTFLFYTGVYPLFLILRPYEVSWRKYTVN